MGTFIVVGAVVVLVLFATLAVHSRGGDRRHRYGAHNPGYTGDSGTSNTGFLGGWSGGMSDGGGSCGGGDGGGGGGGGGC